MIAPVEEQESWEGEEEGGRFGEDRNRFVPALVALAILIAAGGGYAWWSGKLAQWTGKAPDPSLASPETGADKPVVPGLAGEYKAHISDQDISLVLDGNKPEPLAKLTGTISYVNVVTGKSCTSRLVRTGAAGAGDSGTVFSFSQAPVAEKTACAKEIPVKLDVTAQPSGEGGVIQGISAEWLSPGSDRVLMSGQLKRAAAK